MKAIRHFGIVVSDMEKSLHFYRDLLGLKIQRDMPEEGEFIDSISGLKNVKVRTVKMSADDGNLIELLYYTSNGHMRKSQGKKDICEIGASHVAFTVENVDAEYEKLKKEGIGFNCPPKISINHKAKVTFCRDPDNVLVELVEMIKQ